VSNGQLSNSAAATSCLLIWLCGCLVTACDAETNRVSDVGGQLASHCRYFRQWSAGSIRAILFDFCLFLLNSQNSAIAQGVRGVDWRNPFLFLPNHAFFNVLLLPILKLMDNLFGRIF
jgi:hypothetical protein